MVEEILVATDFSPLSNQAVSRAKLIAIATGARLTLTHIVNDDQPERLLIHALSSAKSQLETIVTTFQEEGGIAADIFVVPGESATGILAAAKETDADLIIVGPARNLALGTDTGRTVGKVVLTGHRPMLIAATPALTPYRQCLLAVDFDEASKSAARTALALGVFNHMNVTVLHTQDRERDTEGAMDRLLALGAEIGLDPATSRVVTGVGAPASNIMDRAAKEDADLIIVGTNQRQGFARLLEGSIASATIRDGRRDILIIPMR